MVLINNITDISFNSNKSGNLNFKMLLYNKYFNEFKIKKSVFNKINENKSNTNTLNIFNIQLDYLYLDIFYNSEYYTIQEILIQKQNIQSDEDNITFNIIALKLKKDSILNWYTIFSLGKIYTKIIITPSYFNNKNLISYKKNYKEFKIFTTFVEPLNNQISSINLKNVINIMNKKILLPYSNTSFTDVNFSIQFYPLINPMPKLKINTKLVNNSSSQLVMFNNFNSIDIPEYKDAEFDNMIQNEGIITSIKPLRITENIGEYLMLEIIPETNSTNYDMYHIKYDDTNNDFDVRFNIFSFEFINNYSRQYYYDLLGASIQSKNKIIINTKTNNDIFIKNDIIKPEIYRTINPIPDQKNNKYLTVTSDIITNKKRPIIRGTAKPMLGQNKDDAEIICIKINKNNENKEEYDASFNIHDLSNNKTTGEWVFDTSTELEITDDTFYIDISSNDIEIQIFDNSGNYGIDSNDPSGNIKYKLKIDSNYIEGYDISFQNIYYKNINGQDNHLKINILGLTAEIFDEFNLEDSEIIFEFQNNFNFNINLFVRNMLNVDFSGNLYLSNQMTNENSTYILKKNVLFSDQLDISNGIVEIYPKVLDFNNDFLKYNGTEGSLGIKTLSKNKLFKNIIIDDILVTITGLNNNNRLLININNNKLQLSNKNISFENQNDNFFHKLEFRPLANVEVNRDISENLYYKVRTEPNYYNFIFERLSFFDQSILETNMNIVIISNIIDVGGVKTNKIIENYKTTTISSIRDINFNVTEDNIYYFDMSHESNKGSRLRFFSDENCTKELVKNYNNSSTNDILYNTVIWDDYETLAEYSENIDPGFSGANVKIKIPKVSQIQGENQVEDEDGIIQGKIYYKNKFKYNEKLKDVIPGTIYINKKKDVEIKRPTISKLIDNTGGLLTYNASNYEIFSTLYENDITWKDLSFNMDSMFISNIQPDISYNYKQSGTTKGKIVVYNKGQWYDKQTFITTDISFNRKSNEITKFIFNHELQNVILNISFVDCSNTNHPNAKFVNPVFTKDGDLSLNEVFDYYGAEGYRDISFNDLSYNYYAILENDDGENRTSFFEKYENDYSGNIYLLGAVINQNLNMCQIKLKNQDIYDGRLNFESQYKIIFEDISGTKKIINSETANLSKNEILLYYSGNTDICHNIICKDIYINKFYNPSGNGGNRFDDLNVETTLNLIFTDDKILYGINKNNTTYTENPDTSIDYKLIGNTIYSHKLFIVIDENGRVFFGDDDDDIIYSTGLQNTSENFKLVFSFQDISGNDNEEYNSYDLNLVDNTELNIKNILIKKVAGLSGELLNNNYTNISMNTYNYTDILNNETFFITELEKDDNIFKTNDVFSNETGYYIGLSNNDPSYNYLLTNNKWYDISGITGHDVGTTNSVDTDRSSDIAGGKYGYWFVIDLSRVEFVDQIAITGTNDLSSNPKSFYIYGSTCNNAADDPSKNDQWELLNRFSYIKDFYNYEINKNEYNSNNNYTIYRDLFINTSEKDNSGNTAIPYKFYRLVIFQNFGSKYIQLKNIKFLKNSTVMKNFARENRNYSTKYLNTDQYRNSQNGNQLLNKIKYGTPFILDHSLQYDSNRYLADNGQDTIEFTHYNTDGDYIGLTNQTTSVKNTLNENKYYKDIENNPKLFSYTYYPSNGYDISNNPLDDSGDPQFDLNKNGVYFTFEAKDISDILQTISIKGIGENKYDQNTNIIVNDICSNIQEISIFGKIINNETSTVEQLTTNLISDSNEETSDNILNDTSHIKPEKYSDYFWHHICDISYDINEFINSSDGYVKKWINNSNNYNKSYTFYRIVITKNFGGKYIYIENILLERGKNIIDRRERTLTIKDMSYNIIKQKERATLSQTGFFNIKSNIREITLNNLNNNEIINENRPYYDISLNEITVHLCDISNCSEPIINIFGINQVLLSWDFKCDNIYVNIYFNIYRMQASTDVLTSKKIILLGSTQNKYFYDDNPIPYLIATYYIEPVITWENEILKLTQQSRSKLICKRNRFPYGRYNVRYDNPKLFSFTNGNLSNDKDTFLNEKIKTGNNCLKNNMSSNKKTGILFKNTNVMTKKEIFTMLAKGASRPFR